MTSDESDKDHLEVVVHLDDQAVFVAADVEDNPVVGNKTGTGKLGLNLLWITPSGGLGDDAHTTLRLLPLRGEKEPAAEYPMSMHAMHEAESLTGLRSRPA